MVSHLGVFIFKQKRKFFLLKRSILRYGKCMKLEHKDTVPKIAEYEDSFSCLRLLKSSEQGYIYRKNCVNLSELVQEEKTVEIFNFHAACFLVFKSVFGA